MNRNSLIICLIFLFSIYFSVYMISFVPNDSEVENNEKDKIIENKNHQRERPKKSKFWTEVDVPYIHITGANWTQTNQTYGWCNGKGTKDDPYVIENITINGQGIRNCILIEQSRNIYFVIKNCTVYNSGQGAWTNYFGGIRLKGTSNGTLIGNNCSYNWNGIAMQGSTHNRIVGNILTHNQDSGIHTFSSDFNNITDNFIEHNQDDGMWLYGSDDNRILNNTINDNTNDGMYIEKYCFTNVISENNITYNNGRGINIFDGCRGTKITKNNISGNVGNGIHYDHDSGRSVYSDNYISDNNIGIRIYQNEDHSLNITNNEIIDNRDDGIQLRESNFTIISGNKLIDNADYGLIIATLDCVDDLIYNNSFIGNREHAQDSGLNNHWNTTGLGNYWDNYTGKDQDDNGIGEIPYNISKTPLIQDHFPIWDDGHNGSIIIINDDGLHWNDWEWTSTRTWCTGKGTFTKPYIIRDLVINTRKSGSGITVNNSNVYFKIINCTLFNSSNSGSGIQIINVTNGFLINNNCSFNYGNGISLIGSDINVLSGNNADNNSLFGIYLINSTGNYFSGNNASRNEIGIRLRDSCDINNFTQNMIFNNSVYGVLITNETFDCVNNLFYNNSFNNPDGINAYDNGTNTQWNNLFIGNYWSDYAGCDSNNNGIGETPYEILGKGNAKDYLPICYKSCPPKPKPYVPGGGDDDDDGKKAEAIPGYGLYLIIGIICVISAILIKKRLKIKQ